MENVLLSAQAFGEMSSCQHLCLVMIKNIDARPRDLALSALCVPCEWRPALETEYERLALAMLLAHELMGGGRPHTHTLSAGL